MAETTPIVRCPRCEHPINDHRDNQPCRLCTCRMDPNLIAIALLFGGLTQLPSLPLPTSVKRQPDGSWA